MTDGVSRCQFGTKSTNTFNMDLKEGLYRVSVTLDRDPEMDPTIWVGGDSTVALAREENVPLVDLNVLASAYFTEIGPEATLALFMTGDTLHPNRPGAGELARLVAEDLGRQGL